MNSNTVERFAEEYFVKGKRSGKGSTKGKDNRVRIRSRNGSKGRRTSEYWIDRTNSERRSQTKGKYTTHRDDKQQRLADEDERMQNLHFANFLGCSKLVIDGEMTYNAPNYLREININMCDSITAYMFGSDDDEAEEVVVEEDDEDDKDSWNDLLTRVWL